MEFETFKRRSKKIIIGVVVFCVLGVVVTFATTRAKYRNTESIPLVRGTVNYSAADLNLVAVYIKDDAEYISSSEIPTTGYTLNASESYCKVNEEKDSSIQINYNYSSGGVSINKITKIGTKCYLYFDKYSAKDYILAGLTKSTRTDFSAVLTTNTTGTIYSADDDDGTSYYYAGAVDNNWVKFGGFYWRIVRFNGDGTIRLIYSGTSATATGTDTQTGTSTFSSDIGDNMYVGYMYTNGQVHGLGTESAIKGVLDNWYTSNLASYADKIDTNAGFCNDRQPSTSSSTSNGSGGTGTTETYYGAYFRLYRTYMPSLKCTNSSDLFTKSGATKGNKALTSPIGLITLDEAYYAGGFSAKNTSYYLYTGQDYWAMSPSMFALGFNDNYYVRVFKIQYDGYLNWFDAYNAVGVRPVINLKANTLFESGGTGTSSNPYVVK